MSRIMNMIFGWEEVLVTQNMDHYMKMKNDLNNKGIRSRTEFVNVSSSSSMLKASVVTTYYLYTKKAKIEQDGQ